MDFFNNQQSAKIKTFWLLCLSVIGIILLSIIFTLIINASFTFTYKHPTISFTNILLSITGSTFLVSVYKYATLRQGGKAIAENLGGRLINGQTGDKNERQLLNVIEEIAIAAGVPVPVVYVLSGEFGINAFTAGFTINDTVIGVTQGAMEYLTRDELQAVIGHEFGHILNGDMRLNLKLSALIFGFLFISQIGLYITRKLSFRRPSKEIALITAISCSIAALGWLGALWSNIMQATISRQREYLADASSAQFTRQPKSLASALKKIGGEKYHGLLSNDYARTFSHCFFCESYESLFNTHPPLAERILRIEPYWDGEYTEIIIEPKVIPPTPEPTHTIEYSPSTNLHPVLSKLLTHSAIYYPVVDYNPHLLSCTEQKTRTKEKLLAITKNPMDACYFVFALLLDNDSKIKSTQLSAIKNTQLIEEYHQLIQGFSANDYLIFIEKTIPTLKQLSEPQYKSFKQVIMYFIQADHSIFLQEWLIQQLIIHQLETQYTKVPFLQTNKYHTFAALENEISCLLSALFLATNDHLKAKKLFKIAANNMALYTATFQSQTTIIDLTSSLQKLQKATPTIHQLFLRTISNAMQLESSLSTKKYFIFQTLALCLDYPTTVK